MHPAVDRAAIFSNGNNCSGVGWLPAVWGANGCGGDYEFSSVVAI